MMIVFRKLNYIYRWKTRLSLHILILYSMGVNSHWESKKLTSEEYEKFWPVNDTCRPREMMCRGISGNEGTCAAKPIGNYVVKDGPCRTACTCYTTPKKCYPVKMTCIGLSGVEGKCKETQQGDYNVPDGYCKDQCTCFIKPVCSAKSHVCLGNSGRPGRCMSVPGDIFNIVDGPCEWGCTCFLKERTQLGFQCHASEDMCVGRSGDRGMCRSTPNQKFTIADGYCSVNCICFLQPPPCIPKSKFCLGDNKQRGRCMGVPHRRYSTKSGNCERNCFCYTRTRCNRKKKDCIGKSGNPGKCSYRKQKGGYTMKDGTCESHCICWVKPFCRPKKEECIGDSGQRGRCTSGPSGKYTYEDGFCKEQCKCFTKPVICVPEDNICRGFKGQRGKCMGEPNGRFSARIGTCKTGCICYKKTSCIPSSLQCIGKSGETGRCGPQPNKFYVVKDGACNRGCYCFIKEGFCGEPPPECKFPYDTGTHVFQGCSDSISVGKSCDCLVDTDDGVIIKKCKVKCVPKNKFCKSSSGLEGMCLEGPTGEYTNQDGPCEDSCTCYTREVFCGRPAKECTFPVQYGADSFRGCTNKIIPDKCVCIYRIKGEAFVAQCTLRCNPQNKECTGKSGKKGVCGEKAEGDYLVADGTCETNCGCYIKPVVCGLPPPECTFPMKFGYSTYYSCSDKILPNKCMCYWKNPSGGISRTECRGGASVCDGGNFKKFDYTKIHYHHSASLPSRPQCKILRKESRVSNMDKVEILRVHNRFRSMVSDGEEERSSNKGVPQYPGSNIRELIWNDELAWVAQKWADQCIYEHESLVKPKKKGKRNLCSRTYVVGQNLYYSNRFKTKNSLDDWRRAIRGWFNEVRHLPAEQIKHLGRPKTKEVVNHYTTLMWAITNEIGCGAVYYSGGGYKLPDGNYNKGRILVCNYGPGGNIINAPVYKIGPAASECEHGKSLLYPSLCKGQP